MTVKKIWYKPLGKTTANDLFSINRRGGNDQAWKVAVNVLEVMGVLDLAEITATYFKEREKQCYGSKRSARLERYCSIIDCDKKPSVDSNNNNNKTAVVNVVNATIESVAK